MKKYLILILSLITVFGYSQTLHPLAGTTALSVNNANTLPTTVSGTNTYTATLPSAGTITDATNFFTDITDRLIYYKFTNSATSAPFTLNLNGEGAKDLKKRDATGTIVDIETTDIVAGQTLPIRYNGTYLVIEGGSGSGGISELEVGTTDVTSGTNTRVLYNNSGTLGEYAISGTGSVAMTNSPTFVTPALGTPSSGVATNLTGTASGLTAGNVTTNANLTGDVTSTGNTTSYNTTVPVGKGGTGVTGSSGASSVVLRDASVNIDGNNFISSFATTATAAGTTTLTVASAYFQDFTGSTTQTVVLPVTSTFSKTGHGYYITNNSSGIVTVQTSGGNVIQAMDANSSLYLTCKLTSGTGTASWGWTYNAPSPLTTQGDIIVGGAGGAAARLGIGSAYNLMRVNSGATSPQYFGLTTGSVPFWSATGLTENNAIFFWDNSNSRLGINTNAPTSSFHINNASLGTTQVSTSGITVRNPTAAALGAQQISGAIRQTGFGWGTTAGTSQEVSFQWYVLPVQGTVPSATYVLQKSVAGAAFSTIATFSDILSGLLEMPNVNASTAFASNEFNRRNNAVIAWGASNGHSGIGHSIQYVSAGANSQTSGNQILVSLPSNFSPTSGTATFNHLNIGGTINQTGGANGNVSGMDITTTYTAAGGSVYGYRYRPTVTSVTGNVISFESTAGVFSLPSTVTTAGTTGNQTIDKQCGTVNIAAAGTAVTITNNLVTANSIIDVELRTNDATARIANYVPTTGSFVVNLSAAATAEVSVGFCIITK